MNKADDHDRAVQGQLLELINAGWTTQAIAAACELDLPDRLSSHSRSAAALAAETGADPDAMERLLQALVTLDICEYAPGGTFRVGRAGEYLCRDNWLGLRHWALLNGGPLWNRWASLSRRVREGDRRQVGARSAERFERLESDGHEADLFYGAMAELSRRVGGSMAEQLVLPTGSLVVDVGGGSGELLASVLARHPTARGLLLDLAHALVQAPSVLRSHGVDDRCEWRAGSFFDELPQDGDLYLLKSVLHDWDDESAARVLSRCREAMKSEARLLVVERILPTRLGTTPADRAVARSDLNMLVGLAGRERTRDAFRLLLERSALVIEGELLLPAGFHALRAAPV